MLLDIIAVLGMVSGSIWICWIVEKAYMRKRRIHRGLPVDWKDEFYGKK